MAHAYEVSGFVDVLRGGEPKAKGVANQSARRIVERGEVPIVGAADPGCDAGEKLF